MGLTSTVSFIIRHPLNRAGRTRAISRFIRWQIASRLFDSKIELPFVGETKLLTRRGMTGATGNWYCGLHEPNDMGFLLHMLRPASLFIDIGANVGSYTVLAAGGVGAKVIAIEPIPKTFKHLQDNVLLNDLTTQVQLCCTGISDKSGTLFFTADQDTTNHVLAVGEDATSIKVPVTTLDALCAGRVPEIIKIDVEGHEKSVLLGAAKTLASPNILAVIMETNGNGGRYGIDNDELLSLMIGFGFHPVRYCVLTRTVFVKSGYSANTIFVKNINKVQNIVRNAPQYKLINGYV